MQGPRKSLHRCLVLYVQWCTVQYSRLTHFEITLTALLYPSAKNLVRLGAGCGCRVGDFLLINNYCNISDCSQAEWHAL